MASQSFFEVGIAEAMRAKSHWHRSANNVTANKAPTLRQQTAAGIRLATPVAPHMLQGQVAISAFRTGYGACPTFYLELKILVRPIIMFL